MDRQDKIIILLMLVVFGGSLIAGTILNAQQAEAEEQAQLQARAAQVESVKAYVQDAEDEEQARETTNRQIKAEKAEQARLEAERLEAERLAREQAEAEAKREQELRENCELSTKQYQNEQKQANSTCENSQTAKKQQTGVLTKEGGVNYYNGSRETWYSSNQLYHYRTSEWTVGTDGVYRDKDGYVVVARSDMAQGATLETSLGTGKVYDSGCANGTTDIYTKW
jgi:chemotaxis protein histidine kinase CheA